MDTYKSYGRGTCHRTYRCASLPTRCVHLLLLSSSLQVRPLPVPLGRILPWYTHGDRHSQIKSRPG